MKEFIERIVQTLKTNGFPGKKVSLPTEKMYEAADNKGLSFNSVLDRMKAEYNIEAQIGPEKIIFSQSTDIMKQAQDMMANMDPEELKRIHEMFLNMSPEEKEEILRRGKDLGLL